jgi:hypothetical protein
MSQWQRNTAYVMYVIGLLTGLTWCGAQALRAFTTTEGISLAQYVAFTGGFMVQLVLALEARKEKPGPIITQQVHLFKAWSVCGTALIAIVVIKGGYRWSEVDTVITALASAGVVGTVAWAAFTRRSMGDAAVKAWYNIVLKSLPQFLLVWKVLEEGPAGLTQIAVVLGSVSILTRLIPISISIKTEGYTREKWWLKTSDAINLASWTAVVYAWVFQLIR